MMALEAVKLIARAGEPGRGERYAMAALRGGRTLRRSAAKRCSASATGFALPSPRTMPNDISCGARSNGGSVASSGA